MHYILYGIIRSQSCVLQQIKGIWSKNVLSLHSPLPSLSSSLPFPMLYGISTSFFSASPPLHILDFLFSFWDSFYHSISVLIFLIFFCQIFLNPLLLFHALSFLTLSFYAPKLLLFAFFLLNWLISTHPAMYTFLFLSLWYLVFFLLPLILTSLFLPYYFLEPVLWAVIHIISVILSYMILCNMHRR